MSNGLPCNVLTSWTCWPGSRGSDEFTLNVNGYEVEFEGAFGEATNRRVAFRDVIGTSAKSAKVMPMMGRPSLLNGDSWAETASDGLGPSVTWKYAKTIWPQRSSAA